MEIPDVEDGEIAYLQFQTDGVSGQKADTHARNHGLFDGFRAADLHGDIQVGDLSGEAFFHGMPSVRTPLPDDERLLCDC